jgi:hypothetical protein
VLTKYVGGATVILVSPRKKSQRMQRKKSTNIHPFTNEHLFLKLAPVEMKSTKSSSVAKPTLSKEKKQSKKEEKENNENHKPTKSLPLSASVVTISYSVLTL